MSELNVTDGQWLQRLKEKFQYKRQLARHREEVLFGIFDEPLTEEERFCLQFLYAYMPLHDMANYDGDYFLKMSAGRWRRALWRRGGNGFRRMPS
ncbi:hypothetical protein ABEX25_05365 [Paenibacillus thiaminolyticus]|uniref:hypothetical protein n=1 Tax=Paenibacillus thiaminolyticus TaxID=49283 RepID=UPI003D2763CE